jgi:hypothetical protein
MQLTAFDVDADQDLALLCGSIWIPIPNTRKNYKHFCSVVHLYLDPDPAFQLVLYPGKSVFQSSFTSSSFWIQSCPDQDP